MHFRSTLSALCLSLSLAACGFDGTGPVPTPMPQPQPLPHTQPLSGCEGLAEFACNADPRCVAVYGEADADGGAVEPLVLGALTAGCIPLPPTQPLPFNHCEAVSPANACEGLDEQGCQATAGCQPLYVESQGSPSYGADDVAVGSSGFAGCVPEPIVEPPPSDLCAGLDDATCQATPGCGLVEPVVVGAPEFVEETVGSRCVQVEVQPPTVPGCAVDSDCGEGSACVDGSCTVTPVCPLRACAAVYCPNGMAVDANGCATCGCKP